VSGGEAEEDDVNLQHTIFTKKGCVLNDQDLAHSSTVCEQNLRWPFQFQQ
jgi:hypothetical protein